MQKEDLKSCLKNIWHISTLYTLSLQNCPTRGEFLASLLLKHLKYASRTCNIVKKDYLTIILRNTEYFLIFTARRNPTETTPFYLTTEQNCVYQKISVDYAQRILTVLNNHIEKYCNMLNNHFR